MKKTLNVLFLITLLLAISTEVMAQQRPKQTQRKQVAKQSSIKKVSSQSSSKKYVDLGLTSGTLWATCNVGATKPEEPGDYFAWGETKPKEIYLWSTYKWCNGDRFKQTKYCYDSNSGNNGFTDNKTELDLEDDAAYVNWGSEWRMPSSDQMEELISNCTWEIIKINGVGVYKGTSEKNGKSIIFPRAGWRDGDQLSFGYTGEGGSCWSRTLVTWSTQWGQSAFDLNLMRRTESYWETGTYKPRVMDSLRGYGANVRPVRMK